MIKFFRKIRQELLNKKKVGKYLLYAFGEIVLVIIGILIALNLNQKSEQKKAENKIDALFEDVLLELDDYIDQSTFLITRYRQLDSIASLVLHNKVTFNDYANENKTLFSVSLWNLTTVSNGFDTTNPAYNLLLENIDAIHSKYRKALSLLKGLQTSKRLNVEAFNEVVKRLSIKNHDDFEENYDWYSALDIKKSKEAIDFRLNDRKYKNKVTRIRDERFHHKIRIALFRLRAIETYQEIARVINKPTDSLDFVIETTKLEKYNGIYRNNSDFEFTVEIAPAMEHFLLNRNGEIYARLKTLSSDKLFFIGKGLVRFNVIDGNEIEMTISEGHTAVTYTKTNN